MNSSLLAAVSAMLAALTPEELDEKLTLMRSDPNLQTGSESLAVVQAVAEVVREKLALAREIDELARIDAATGLPTRRAFDERLELELRRSARSRTSFALVILDVHEDSAQKLRSVGATVARHVRLVDFAARFAPSQCAMILVDVDHSTLRVILERLLQAIKQTGVSVRAGFALSFPVDNAQTIIERADAALYDARFN